MRHLGCVVGLLLFTSVSCAPTNDTATIQVFAAASLTDVLHHLADRFEAAHPPYQIALNVAATSLLARQIDHGAPADVFFSANPAWMAYLDSTGRLTAPIRYPAKNRLVVIAPKGAARLADPDPLTQAERLALADPAHVPAGIYAEQALRCAGLWEAVASRVVPALDVRAALLTVQHAAADYGIVYASDVRGTANVEVVLEWPTACQPTIRYAVASLRNATQAAGAQAFIDYALAPAQQPIWVEFGFLPDLLAPAEAAP